MPVEEPSVPPIAAPDIARQLDGLALSEAFRRFVLNDPEVKRLGEAAIAIDESARSVFEGGTFGLMGGAWPVRIEDWDVGNRIVNPFVQLNGIEHPVPEPIRQAGNVIEARVLALMQLLRDGRVRARQEEKNDWIYVEQWRWDRSETRVHFKHGDLYDNNEDKGRTPIYRSLQIVDHARTSAKQESSTSVIRGKAGAPATYPWEEVLDWLLSEFAERGFPSSINALKNMVQNYLSESGYKGGPADSTVKEWLQRAIPVTLQRIKDRRKRRS